MLFARDGRGRLVATRDPTPRPAPRLFLGRSRDGNVWATRCDVDAATSAALHALCAAEPRLDDPGAARGPAVIARRLSARAYGENWHVT